MLSARIRGTPFLHVTLGRRAGMILSIRNGEELVFVGLVHHPGHSGSEIVRKIKLFERRERKAKAQVNEQPRRDDG